MKVAVQNKKFDAVSKRDIFAWSQAIAKINLRELLNELQIKWNISRQ